MSREDQYNVTVSVAYGGVTHDLGTFDSFTGGEVTSEDTKYWPGGLANQISLGGRRTVNNFTVGRLYDLARDHPLMGWLMGGAGKAVVTATKTSLTVDDVAISNPLVYEGILLTVTPPAHDSNSSGAAKYELEVSSAAVHQGR